MGRLRVASLLLLLPFSNATYIFAQSNDTIFTNKHRHELEIGYGTPSFLFAIGNAFTHDNIKFPVNIQTQYMYNLTKHFSAGANLTYSAYYKEYYEMGEYCCDVGRKIGESNYYHLFTLGLTGRAYWFYKKHWAMYSKYGLTMSIISDDGSTIFWPLNFSLVGVEVGGNKLRGYIEPLNFISTWPAAHIGVKYLF